MFYGLPTVRFSGYEKVGVSNGEESRGEACNMLHGPDLAAERLAPMGVPLTACFHPQCG